jgi:hypothetical protein
VHDQEHKHEHEHDHDNDEIKSRNSYISDDNN